MIYGALVFSDCEAEADGWIGSPLPKQDLLFCSVVGERGSFYAAPAKVSLRSR